MPIFPQIGDIPEWRRRQLLEEGLLGGRPSPLNPDAPPDLPTSAPTPLPAAGNPGAIAGPTPPARQGRYGEMREAKDVYLKGTPGRFKSAALGALRGALHGAADNGLGGLVGGAVAGAAGGGINPRGLREQQFNEQIGPQIAGRFAAEDAEAQRLRQAGLDEQNALMARAKIEDVEAGVDLKRSQAQRNRLPRPERKPQPINTAKGLWDPVLQQYIPGTEPPEKRPGPNWKRDARGEWVDLNAPENKGKKVKGYDRPRSPRQPKGEKKVISITKVREAAAASGGKMSVSDVAARFREQGFTIDKTR